MKRKEERGKEGSEEGRESLLTRHDVDNLEPTPSRSSSDSTLSSASPCLRLPLHEQSADLPGRP